jgi:hypothetical protein
MCATERTPIGPEMALLSQRTPLSLEDARVRGVLYDELDGASAEWTFAEEDAGGTAVPAARGHRTGLWSRLFGRAVRPSGPWTVAPDVVGRPGPCPVPMRGGSR